MDMDGISENFSLNKIYSKTFEEIHKSFKNLTEPGFLKWKKFVDFIIQKNFTDVFNCKFVTPLDFEKLDFPEDKWEDTIKAILGTGIKSEQNLFFRIPQFLKYIEKEKNGFNTIKGGAQSKGGELSGTSVIDPNKKYRGGFGH